MKNIYITVGVIIVLAGGFFFFLGKSKEAKTPVSKISAPIIDTTIKPSEGAMTVCTMDAKMCPGGSYVGRTGPNCEFTVCPPVNNTQTVKEFKIIGKNFSFEPSLITVAKGDRVKITFENSAGFHDFRIDAYGVATKQTQSPTTEVLEFTADKVGSFEYYCSVGTHRALGMKGTLKVE